MPDKKNRKVLKSFLTTQNLNVAWKVYRDWYAFQEQLGREGEVGFAVCSVNQKTQWRVLVTRSLRDARRDYPMVEEPSQQSSNAGSEFAVPAAFFLLSVLL